MICLQEPASVVPVRVVDWWFSTVMGFVEGLTEFLPVSSTGHLIVTSRLFGREDPAFEISIQVGAITAILFLYRERLWRATRDVLPRRSEAGTDARHRVNLLWLIGGAAVPPAVLGLLFQDSIESYLFSPATVGCTLVIGGLLLMWLEAWEGRRGFHEEVAPGIEDMTMRQAFLIGLFQSLALVPGTSRSGATIAGAMLVGMRRTAAAEFSFLVGLPILYGASFVQLVKNPGVFGDSVLMAEYAIAAATSFVAAWFVVRPFVRFLQKHTFMPFAWYRIAAGAVLLVLVWRGAL